MLSYIVSAQIDAVSMYVCFIFMIKHMVFRHTYIERKRFAHERKSRAKRVCPKSMTGRGFLDMDAYLNYKKSKKTVPLSRNRHFMLYR